MKCVNTYYDKEKLRQKTVSARRRKTAGMRKRKKVIQAWRIWKMMKIDILKKTTSERMMKLSEEEKHIRKEETVQNGGEISEKYRRTKGGKNIVWKPWRVLKKKWRKYELHSYCLRK